MKTHIIFALTIAIAINAFAQQALHRFGTVRYPDGEPAVGVHITFYPGYYYSDDDYNYHEAITDKNGHYEIIPPKKTSMFYDGPIILTNSIMARDFEKNLAAVQAFSVTTTNVNVDMTLQPAIILSGSVKDTEGAPVSGAALEIRFDSGGSLPSLSPQPTKANELGQFFITALPQGFEYLIWGVTAKGYGSAYARVEAKDTQTSRYEFPTLVLKHADHKLAGQVLDNNGHPIAGANVRFYGQNQPENSSTKTDSKGNFVFDAVCAGQVQLSANAFSDTNSGHVFMTSDSGAGFKAQAGDTNIVINISDPDFATLRMTPLHKAARDGDTNEVELLLTHGADVDAKDNYGNTPLHLAAANDHKDVAELLLAHGAEVNARDNQGVTPLHKAVIGHAVQVQVRTVYVSSMDMVEFLLTNKADVNVKADNGFTSLHWAALYGHKDVAELLLAHGAEINARNNAGKTPLYWAIQDRRPDVAELLRQHGGQE
jgi:protocatechuate 3,4-dioxygenase beta subunit